MSFPSFSIKIAGSIAIVLVILDLMKLKVKISIICYKRIMKEGNLYEDSKERGRQTPNTLTR